MKSFGSSGRRILWIVGAVVVVAAAATGVSAVSAALEIPDEVGQSIGIAPVAVVGVSSPTSGPSQTLSSLDDPTGSPTAEPVAPAPATVVDDHGGDSPDEDSSGSGGGGSDGNSGSGSGSDSDTNDTDEVEEIDETDDSGSSGG